MRVSEIRVNQIRVNQGLGVVLTFSKLMHLCTKIWSGITPSGKLFQLERWH